MDAVEPPVHCRSDRILNIVDQTGKHLDLTRECAEELADCICVFGGSHILPITASRQAFSSGDVNGLRIILFIPSARPAST